VTTGITSLRLVSKVKNIKNKKKLNNHIDEYIAAIWAISNTIRKAKHITNKEGILNLEAIIKLSKLYMICLSKYTSIIYVISFPKYTSIIII
jgi:hypothetical protein